MKNKKFRYLCGGIAGLILSMGSLLSGAQNETPANDSSVVKKTDNSIPAFILDAYVKLDDECVEAIARAQKELAKRQNPDGSFSGQYGRSNAGETAFAILALMVNGTVPGEGDYSKNIALATQFLMNLQTEAGVIATRGQGGTMYQHALATLALSEVYGMTTNPRVRATLIKAVNLIVNVQHSTGGWRYEPTPQIGDISISVMQVMALRSAADAGIYVPEKTFERAVSFIRSCYNTKEKGFTYMPNSSGKGFARTAAGVVSMQSLGLGADPIVKDTAQYMVEGGFKDRSYFWYGHYYASVALYHYGGKEWQEYYPKIKKHILDQWKRSNWRFGGTLDTAWSILILGVPYRYLPIYQR